jgi:hypothetical protein
MIHTDLLVATRPSPSDDSHQAVSVTGPDLSTIWRVKLGDSGRWQPWPAPDQNRTETPANNPARLPSNRYFVAPRPADASRKTFRYPTCTPSHDQGW